MSGKIYNIPAGTPFAAALAQGLLDQANGDPLALAAMRVLLPSRRACRTLREAFLRQSDGVPLLLPRLQPLGDMEESDLAIGADPELAEAVLKLPPAMPPMRRRILLARAVIKMEGMNALSMDQAMALADDLALLLDRVQIENVGLEMLDNLAPDHAAHWISRSVF